MTFADAVSRPFAALGGLVRASGQVFFNRTRNWGLWLTRLRLKYREEVGDPLTNSIVGSVVGWIARNFPEAPVRIVREDDPEGIPITRSLTGPGAMLRLLEKPNEWFAGIVMWKATIVDYLRGDAYWLKVRSDSGRVVALWWIPRAMMRPAWPADDPTVFIGWYEYRVDGVVYAVDPKDVVHFRNGMNPATQGRTGVDELEALWREIFTDEEAAAFTAAVLRNLGVPGVVIAPSNTTAGKAQTLQADPEGIKEKFQDAFGADRRGEPLVLTAPTDVKVLSWNPQELDLKSLRRIPEERISARLGVPAGVAGLGAGLDRNTFTNYGEANVAAYTQGVIPRQREIAADLEVQLLPDFVADGIETYDVFFDAKVTAAMSSLAAAIRDAAARDAIRGLITRATYKRLTGQPVAKDGADDVYIYPNNFLIVPVARGGGQSPTPPAIPAVRARAELPAGAEAPEPLLLAAGGEVRCSGCDRLLAEQAAAPYRIRCQRCKTVNESAVAEPELAAA